MTGESSFSLNNKKIEFTDDYSKMNQCSVIFLAVGTPSLNHGEANLSYLFQAAQDLSPHLQDQAIVIVKSTVPVGTTKKIHEHIKNYLSENKTTFIGMNPEFLREGNAIEDFLNPDRVIIGYPEESPQVFQTLKELYAPLDHPQYRNSNQPYFHQDHSKTTCLGMSLDSAEMTKYAANCLLATKISFMNELTALCEKTGAEIKKVQQGISLDHRIGPHFLNPGIGYGGSCFPKDLDALIHLAETQKIPLKIIQSAKEVNKNQRARAFQKLSEFFNHQLDGKVFSFLGVAFKPNTDDIREAPAIELGKMIACHGGQVRFYDPKAGDNFLHAMKDQDIKDPEGSFIPCQNVSECTKESDALILLTEWSEFHSLDLKYLLESMKGHLLFDTRYFYHHDQKNIESMGFHYLTMDS